MRSASDPAPEQLDIVSGLPSPDPFRGPPLDRRSMLFGASAAAFLAPALLGEGEAAAATPPCPWSSIRLGRIDGTWLWKRGVGADQWPSSYLEGGGILAAWGDGYGWNKGSTERKAFIGVTRISGSVTGPVGTDLWGSTSLPIKPCAVIANVGEPFMYVTSDRDDRDATWLMTSSNGARSWSGLIGPVISKSTNGLQVVGFADRNPAVGTNEIVLYLAADGNRKTEDLYNAPKNRVVWGALLNRSWLASAGSWLWYAGYGSTPFDRKLTSRAPWESSSGPEPRPVFQDPEGMGKHFQVSWCPSISRYVAAKCQLRTGLGLFEAPTPWGPWRTMWYGNLITAGDAFTAKAISMWSTGSTLAVMWSGSPAPEASNNFDAVYMTRFRA